MTELRPHTGPQTAFLASSADITGYGGAAGGGKTYAQILEALRHVCNPRFNAVIFRRTSEQVRQTGGLWDQTTEIYPQFGARPREAQLDWRFPSGAVVKMDSMALERDKLEFQGAEICLIEFDELTHFTESQFFYLLSRNRSTCGVRPYVRATFNPDPNSWVKRFFAPWVDKRCEDPAADGEVRWFIRDGDLILWVPKGTPDAKSVTFVHSTVYDNPTLMSADPGYLANLKALNAVDRARLLHGDWDTMEAGNMFAREWFAIVRVAPAIGSRVRYWDMAATKPKPGSTDPDWTAGCRMVHSKGISVIEDMKRIRDTPLNIEKLILQTAQLDGKGIPIRIEQEGGASGVIVSDHYIRNVLQGYDVRFVSKRNDKVTEAKPLSAQAEAGNVMIVEGIWNDDFLNELAPFPNPKVHDDQVDASSGAYNHLAGKPTGPVAVASPAGAAVRSVNDQLRT